MRADMKLDELHAIIQIAMGWFDCHLHQFTVGNKIYGMSDVDFGDEDILDETGFTVATLVPAAKKKCVYEYDFGDSWEHEVLAEKILPPDPAFKHPVCLAGANNCPPEDCGGIYGYYNLLRILADPKHPEHEEMRAWIGEDVDPGRFDLDDTNEGLKGV